MEFRAFAVVSKRTQSIVGKERFLKILSSILFYYCGAKSINIVFIIFVYSSAITTA